MFCPDCLLAPGPHPSSCVRLGRDPQGQRILLNVEGSSLELQEGLDRLRAEGCPESDLERIQRMALGEPEPAQISTSSRSKSEPTGDSEPGS